MNPHDVLRIMGPREVQLHLVREVQEVYRSQGVAIHDKHIEVIIRQMLKRITVIESGATEFLPGSLVERSIFEAENRRAVAEGTEPASGRPVLMGITKASLATESWLSAASFQETTRVLTDAAISAKSDSLVGLKENVIIGKLIPAGTGIARYRNVDVNPTEEARAAAFSMAGYDENDYYGFGRGGPRPGSPARRVRVRRLPVDRRSSRRGRDPYCAGSRLDSWQTRCPSRPGRRRRIAAGRLVRGADEPCQRGIRIARGGPGRLDLSCARSDPGHVLAAQPHWPAVFGDRRRAQVDG